MKSIYNAADNAELIQRINQLEPNKSPLWGKMSADQMLKHTSAAAAVAFGKKELKINFIMKLFGKALKNKVFNSDFKKNSPTAPELIFKERYNFDESKQELIHNIELLKNGSQTITVMNHPFWGKMSYEDWDKLLYKHTDYHLKQFGV